MHTRTHNFQWIPVVCLRRKPYVSTIQQNEKFPNQLKMAKSNKISSSFLFNGLKIWIPIKCHLNSHIVIETSSLSHLLKSDYGDYGLLLILGRANIIIQDYEFSATSAFSLQKPNEKLNHQAKRMHIWHDFNEGVGVFDHELILINYTITFIGRPPNYEIYFFFGRIVYIRFCFL